MICVCRGLAFVEFYTVEHASYALQSSEASQLLSSDGTPLKVSYARESFMTQQISMVSEHMIIYILLLRMDVFI